MKSIVKYKLKKVIPRKIWSGISKQFKNYDKSSFCETNKQFGKLNNDIEVYIIRRKPPGAGLFSNVNHVLQGLIYAEKKGMNAVVDMKNYSTEYSRIRKFNGSKNAWEYFFYPVTNVNLADAYKSKNVTLSEGDRILKNHIMSGRNLAYVLDNEFLEKSHKIYTKHIKLNNYSNSYIEYILKAKEIVPDSTLGVFLRGTDYLLGPTGHPIQPDITDVIKDIIGYLESKPIERIFLSTDDIQLRKKLEDKFGSLVIQSVRSDSESSFSDELHSQFVIPKGAIARNLSYLSEIYILSKLSFNISSLSNGSAIMQVINGQKFTDRKLYYYGVN
jgi:hypothetical protein